MDSTHQKLEQKKEHFTDAIYIAALINLILGLSKIAIGHFYDSHALVIDGIHSFSDLLTDVAIFWISSIAHKKPDQNHPYGHEKFETLGTVALGSILLVTAGALVYETVEKLLFLKAQQTIPQIQTLYMAFVSILLNEFLFRYTIYKSKKIDSQLLAANAWHHRTDAISSIIVLISVFISRYSYPWLDDLAALIIAIMIARVGQKYLLQAIQELSDRGLDKTYLDKLDHALNEIDEIKSYHNLRTRKMGERVLVDINIEVSPTISVTEGHEISTLAANKLNQILENKADVTVHIDTENDMEDEFSHNYEQNLPLRSDIITILTELDQELLNSDLIKDIRLHYFQNKIDIEFLLDQKMEQSNQAFSKLKEKLKQYHWFHKLKILTIYEV